MFLQSRPSRPFNELIYLIVFQMKGQGVVHKCYKCTIMALIYLFIKINIYKYIFWELLNPLEIPHSKDGLLLNSKCVRNYRCIKYSKLLYYLWEQRWIEERNYSREIWLWKWSLKILTDVCMNPGFSVKEHSHFI